MDGADLWSTGASQVRRGAGSGARGIRKIWKDPRIGKKASSPYPSAILKAGWANLSKFMSRFTRVSVFVLAWTFSQIAL